MSATLLTLTEAETSLWNRILDNDSAGHKVSSTLADALLNRAYCIVKGIRDDRPQELSATTTGLTLAQGDLITSIGVTKPIRHILHAFCTASAGSTTPASVELQRWPRSEIFRMWGEDNTQGAPTAAAFWRMGTATAADVGKWSASFWRIPDGAYYVALSAIVDPTPLSTGSDKFDVEPEVSQAIVDMAASVAARLVGRHELAAAIREDVPAIFSAAFNQMESDYFGKVAADTEATG